MAMATRPVSDAADLVAAGAQLIDVREPGEVASGMLTGARNIPLGQRRARAGELDRSRPVALVCRSDQRSDQAARMLASEGFAELINLAGGMAAAGSPRRPGWFARRRAGRS